MRRVSLVVLGGVVAVLGLAGCAATGGGATAVPAGSAEVSAEARALALMGYDTGELGAGAEPVATQAPDPTPTARAGRRDRDRPRAALRRNTLHGEVVVKTRGGTKTVVVQRGTVTAITATTVTVKSIDGFTLTWTFGDKLRVLERRTTVQPKDVAVGAVVGLAGAKDGDKPVARLVVVRKGS